MVIFDDFDPALVPTLASEETHAMLRQLAEDRRLGEAAIPDVPVIFHSAHVNLLEQGLRHSPSSLIVLGAPGLGKSHTYDMDRSLAGRFAHVEYKVDFDGWQREMWEEMYPNHYIDPNAPYVGDRKVNKAQKLKNRSRNRAARKARRN